MPPTHLLAPTRSRRAVAGAALAAALTGSMLLGDGAWAAPAQAPAGTEIALTVSWAGSQLVAGERSVVSGSASPASSVKRVVLQRRTPEGWTKVAAVSPTTSRYSFRLPTGWYGRFTYRLQVDGMEGVRAVRSSNRRISVVPPYVPRGSARAHTLAAAPIARWDPCRVIGYRVNATQAGAGALKDVKGALRRVYQATGLRFAYRGKTQIIPQDFYNTYPDGTDLVFAWVRPGETPLLSGGGPMGVGGAAWSFGYHNADGSPASQIVSGYVVLDATRQNRLPAGFGRGATRGELLMHEIGHAIGLQHVEDRRQLMYPLMQPGVARWGAGDLAGLAKLGMNRGCLS